MLECFYKDNKIVYRKKIRVEVEVPLWEGDEFHARAKECLESSMKKVNTREILQNLSSFEQTIPLQLVARVVIE